MKAMAVLLAVTTVGLGITSARAQVTDNEVVVKDISFQPSDLKIDPGETVTWRVEQDDHTITAEDGSFDFRVNSGDVKDFTFRREGTFPYFCRIHASMRGVVRVGDGCPGECAPTCRDCGREARTVPSLRFPTIQTALDGAPPRTVIAVRPGRYDVASTLVVATPGVEIRGVTAGGAPAPPGRVVLRGEHGATVGIRVTAQDTSPFTPVAVRNVTLTGFLETGISVESSEHFTLAAVRALNNGSYGIRTVASTSGVLDRVFASGHRRAGISVESCNGCGILIEHARSYRNFLGLQGLDASGVVVRRSLFEANANGVLLRSPALEDDRDHAGVHLVGNTIRDNGQPDAPAPQLSDAGNGSPAGAGIWIQGGADNVVEVNAVTGNHYGIVVTAGTRLSKEHRVLDNDLAGNTVDLAWDGIGIGVCFAGNAHSSSEPADIEDLYPCGRAPSVGVPHPRVLADLAVFAWRTYHCKQLDEQLCL